jgi:hypothetical protein
MQCTNIPIIQYWPHTGTRSDMGFTNQNTTLLKKHAISLPDFLYRNNTKKGAQYHGNDFNLSKF